MATQKGILPIVGTLGGVNFYYRKGKAVARKAGGGFNGKAIKTKPSMVRVRENNSEFGNCSKVKSAFRQALAPFLEYYSDGTLHGRMMHLFQEIKKLDATSARGLRTVGNGILTAEGRELFTHFRFTPSCNIGEMVPMKARYDAATCVYSVVDFAIGEVKFPKGATHLELRFGVLGVDFETKVYKMFMGAPLLLAKGVAVGSFSLTPTVLPDAGLHRFAFVGICFYQELNGVRYVLREDGNVGVAVVV
jgi:hypothetical protein